MIPAEGFLVLGSDSNISTNGGVNIDYQYFDLFLANGSDELYLYDTEMNLVDWVEWDGGPTFPDPNGASMALQLPVFDNAVGSNWCEAVTPFGLGDTGTPGGPNDCQEMVVISEIMYNPDAVGDVTGEWFEVHNWGVSPVDIEGWTISDNAGSFIINTGSPVLIPASGFMVFSPNLDPGVNGGVEVDIQYSGLFLSNSADRIALQNSGGKLIDEVIFDDGLSLGFPLEIPGTAIAIASPALDNMQGANWVNATTPYGDGDLGTPGRPNYCGDVPDLIIQNRTYYTGERVVCAVSDSITTALDVVVQRDARVSYIASTLQFNPGFVVEAGGVLSAAINIGVPRHPEQ